MRAYIKRDYVFYPNGILLLRIVYIDILLYIGNSMIVIIE